MKNLLKICVMVILAVMVIYRLTSFQIGAKLPNPPNDTWVTDFSAAKLQAANERKKLLLDFTASDWSGSCKRLESEVLTTEEFKDFARDYVLVRIDFPHSAQLPPALKEQNDALAQQFQVNGFPTLIKLDSSGQELGRVTGYHAGTGFQTYFTQFK
jgi:thiol:disulfide interchange protein